MSLLPLMSPVKGDFRDQLGARPATVAETVRIAAEGGLAGLSSEETVVPTMTSYRFDLALGGIGAAITSVCDASIVLTARADGCLLRNYDKTEALGRYRAFADAGADVRHHRSSMRKRAVRWPQPVYRSTILLQAIRAT